MKKITETVYEYDFPYGQEGFLHLYNRIVQPHKKEFNSLFPQYSEKIWSGTLTVDKKEFTVHMIRRLTGWCTVQYLEREGRIRVYVRTRPFHLLLLLLFLVIQLGWLILKGTARWEPFFILNFFMFIAVLQIFLARREKKKSIEYNLKMLAYEWAARKQL